MDILMSILWDLVNHTQNTLKRHFPLKTRIQGIANSDSNVHTYYSLYTYQPKITFVKIGLKTGFLAMTLKIILFIIFLNNLWYIGAEIYLYILLLNIY